MKGQKIVIILLVGAFFISESTSSSIPMFEFLTKNEKVRNCEILFLSEKILSEKIKF